MNDRSTFASAISIAFILLATCTLMICMYKIGQVDERKKATAAGVGRWVVHPKTGETQYEYGHKSD